MKKLLIGLAIIMFNVMISHAQDANLDEQAGNFLRESGKLYVVITILVTIFAGIVVFLMFQERKISQLEKKLKDKEKP